MAGVAARISLDYITVPRPLDGVYGKISRSTVQHQKPLDTIPKNNFSNDNHHEETMDLLTTSFVFHPLFACCRPRQHAPGSTLCSSIQRSITLLEREIPNDFLSPAFDGISKLATRSSSVEKKRPNGVEAGRKGYMNTHIPPQDLAAEGKIHNSKSWLG